MVFCVIHAPVFSTGTARSKAKANKPTAFELLDKYTETRDKFRSFISKAENTIEYATKPITKESRLGYSHLKNFNRLEFRYDGKRANQRTYMWGEIFEGRPAVPKKDPYYTSRLRTKEMRRWYGRANLTEDPGRVTIEKRPKVTAEVSLARAYKGHEAIGYLYADDERVDVVLREAGSISVRDKMQQVGKTQCYVIDAQTKKGKYTIWIDPEHGYNIAKAEVTRKAGDILIDKAIKGADRYYTSVSNIRFKLIDGVWIPVEADIKYRWHLPNSFGYAYWEKIHHRVTEFAVNPDHDALDSFASDDIENGAKVSIKGHRSAAGQKKEYIWQDGQAVDDKGQVVFESKSKKAGRR
jgi:hypothetical protein